MIAGEPGTFKSTLALNLLCSWVQQGMTAIYVSADSDENTVAKRCAGILTGEPMAEIEKTIRTGAYGPWLSKLEDVRWEFTALDVPQIDKRVQAFETVYGHRPDLIVIDNLMNCVERPDDWPGQLMMTRDLDALARGAGSHVMILHHMKEEGSPTPPPAWRVQGKVNQFPRLILSLAAVQGHLMVAPVKNTNGPQDKTGETFLDFIVDTSSGQIHEL
jgi:predicted ATP-dependent serine protease